MTYFKRWLLLGPHPDDVELGCGGIISKYSHSGIDIYYVVISPALEDSRNKNIIHELHGSAKVLGLKSSNIRVLKYPRRVLHEYRNDIRQNLINLVAELDPDLIFTTTPDDLHQDHALIGEEVARLFRDVSVLGYEVVNSSHAFVCNFAVALDDDSLNRKIQALACYKSQSYRWYYFAEDVVRSVARMRGAQVKMKYAEGFHLMRMVAK